MTVIIGLAIGLILAGLIMTRFPPPGTLGVVVYWVGVVLIVVGLVLLVTPAMVWLNTQLRAMLGA